MKCVCRGRGEGRRRKGEELPGLNSSFTEVRSQLPMISMGLDFYSAKRRLFSSKKIFVTHLLARFLLFMCW